MWNLEPIAYHLHLVPWANLKPTLETKHCVELINP